MNKIAKSALRYILLSIVCLSWIVPIVFVIFTALKTNQDLVSYSWFVPPKTAQWSNFAQAWTQGNLLVYMRNSLIICLIKVPLGIFICAMAAFALTRLHFKWADAVFAFFLVGMMIPAQVTLVPNKILLSKLHLFNTIPGLIIIYCAFGLSFSLLLLRGYMRTIPFALDEAACIDGCNKFQLFTKIILPMCKPIVAALVIFDFLGTWNDFLFAQIFIYDDDLRTITTGLLQFQGTYSVDYPLLSAGLLISIIPVFIIFVFFQNHLVEGLSGSIKQ